MNSFAELSRKLSNKEILLLDPVGKIWKDSNRLVILDDDLEIQLKLMLAAQCGETGLRGI